MSLTLDALWTAYSRAFHGLADRVRRWPPDSAARRVAGRLASAIRPPELRNGLTALLADFSKLRNATSFVQIGANDGRKHDPLHELLLAGGWTGVMVEPVPYIFGQLRENYAGVAGLRFENAAIADRDGELPFHYLRASSEAGLPDWHDGIGSFRKDVLLSHRWAIPDIDDRVVTDRLPCLTFDSLCRKHQLAQVDVLLIDTEGYDADILRSIDLARWQPSIVIFERYHLPPDLQLACHTQLHRHGYATLDYAMDTIGVSAAALPKLRWRWRLMAMAAHFVRAPASHSAD